MSILKTWIFETKESHITFSDKKTFNKICGVYNLKDKVNIWKKLNLLEVNDSINNDLFDLNILYSITRLQ